MSDTFKQIAVAVVTAGAVSFGTIVFYAGQKDQQIESNKDDIATLKSRTAKIPAFEIHIDNMIKRLDTYEHLVIEGQKEILKEISKIRIDSAKQSTKIGAIEIDIKEINEKINK